MYNPVFVVLPSSCVNDNWNQVNVGTSGAEIGAAFGGNKVRPHILLFGPDTQPNSGHYRVLDGKSSIAMKSYFDYLMFSILGAGSPVGTPGSGMCDGVPALSITPMRRP